MELGDVVAVHVGEEKGVEAAGMEGVGNLVGVADAMDTQHRNERNVNDLLFGLLDGLYCYVFFGG